MHFTEPTELEDKVGLLRSERMLAVAAADLCNPPGGLLGSSLDLSSKRSSPRQRRAQRREREQQGGAPPGAQQRDTLFGNNLTVARLFASSPPEETYVIDEDDLRDDEGGGAGERSGSSAATSVLAATRVTASTKKATTAPRSSADADVSTAAAPLQFVRELVPVVVACTSTCNGSAADAATGVATAATSGDAPRRLNIAVRSAGMLAASLGLLASSSSNALPSPFNQQGLHRGGGAKIGLVLYLPDSERTAVKLQVPAKSSVAEAVALLVKLEYAGRSERARLAPEAVKYEVRIHEEDGLPDLDFPALDGDMEIANFCEGAWAEFCVCAKAGADVAIIGRVAARSSSSSSLGACISEGEAGTAEAAARQEAEAKEERGMAGKPFTLVKVHLPVTGRNTTHTRVRLFPWTTAQEVLRPLKHQLPLFSDDYEFLLTEEDRARLGAISRKVGMKTNLYELKIQDIELCRRVYADAPPSGGKAGRGVGGGGVGGTRGGERAGAEGPSGAGGAAVRHRRQVSDGRPFRQRERERGNSGAIHHEDNVVSIKTQAPPLRFNPDNFLFNEQTAAMYEEWNVKKTNKWGKTQRRVLGMDHKRIYNKKQDRDLKNHMLTNHTVKRADRLIVELHRFGISRDDETCIEVWWRDSTDAAANDLVSKYEVERGAETAAYIVAKLKYILGSTAT